MSKYNAKKVTHDGYNFDSIIEKDYYIYLQNLKRKGEIKDFVLQPSFTLQPKFTKNNKNYQPIKYNADFKIIHNDNSEVIVDVKGFVNAVFKMKEKMFHYHFKEKLMLVTYSKLDGGWVTLDQLDEGRKKRKVVNEEKKKLKEKQRIERESKYMNKEDLKIVDGLTSGISMTARTKKSFLKYIKENYTTLHDVLNSDESLISNAYRKKVIIIKSLLVNYKVKDNK